MKGEIYIYFFFNFFKKIAPAPWQNAAPYDIIEGLGGRGGHTPGPAPAPSSFGAN